MKKNLLQVLFLMAGFLLGMEAAAQSFYVEGLRYSVLSEEDSTVELFKAQRCVKNFVIPDQVEYEGKSYTVIEINYDAFMGLDCLDSIDVGAVQTIEDGIVNTYEDNGAKHYIGAFARCNNLKGIKFRGVIEVGNYSFYGCENVVSINMTEVERIGKGAFQDCFALRQVEIGQHLKSLARSAFEGAEGIEQVTVHAMEVPECDVNAFPEQVVQHAVLCVPAGKKADYQSAPGWSGFTHIKEMSATGISSMTDVKDLVTIQVKSGLLTVSGLHAGAIVRFYDGQGRQIFHQQVEGTTLSISVPSIPYGILRIGNRSLKVALK